MERKGYFAARSLHTPVEHRRLTKQWIANNRERVREQTRLRVARFRAKRK